MILQHKTVMLSEVLAILRPSPEKVIVDATIGGAGHTKAILESGANVIGIDQDITTLQRLEKLNLLRLDLINGNFREIVKLVDPESVEGVLFDIGVSSFQLDDPSRGFSYRQDGPLDMRMSDTGETATDIVNTWPVDELARIIYEFGEEKFSRRIARAIVEARERDSIVTTMQLVEIIRRAYPKMQTRTDHPARRTFQALRICVNDELQALREGIVGAASVLKPGGRIVVISFHSLEDRIVKYAFRSSVWQPLTKRPITPTEQEIMLNPRARSAKLRAAERSHVSDEVNF